MLIKALVSLYILLVFVESKAFVKRDAQTSPNILDSFQVNMDQFRKCIDQGLAKTVGDVNEKQLQPIFTLIGDQLNRINQAITDLTPKKSV